MSMKCPQCGAWTSVMETRTRKTENVVVRRYECANLHRFKTEEKVTCIAVKSPIVQTSTVPDALKVWQKSVSDIRDTSSPLAK